MNVPYVEDKIVDWEFVGSALEYSSNQNRWTNFGPVANMLESRIKSILRLPKEWAVVACASGTAALFALVEMHNDLAGRDLDWTVSSFGFNCTIQGPLKGAKVADCGFDGIMGRGEARIETDVFGTGCVPRWGDLVIEDRAAAMDGKEWSREGVVSFHHTKPWGFGEGGCAVVRSENELLFRSLINFGQAERGSNGKMSDIAAAFILDRLRTYDQWSPRYREQWDRVARIAAEYDISTLGRRPEGTPPCACLVFNSEVGVIESPVVTRKYYRPLSPTPIATDLYKRIMNFPCHPGLDQLRDGDIRTIFESIIA